MNIEQMNTDLGIDSEELPPNTPADYATASIAVVSASASLRTV
jgi:hypothetical protein